MYSIDPCFVTALESDAPTGSADICGGRVSNMLFLESIDRHAQIAVYFNRLSNALYSVRVFRYKSREIRPLDPYPTHSFISLELPYKSPKDNFY